MKKFFRELFYKKISTTQYGPSSRKLWATLFCLLSLIGFILKFWGIQTITSEDLAILSGLAVSAVGWYTYSAKDPVPSDNNEKKQEVPPEAFLED